MSEVKQQLVRKGKEGTTYQGKTGCGEVYVTINPDEVFIKLGKAGGCAGANMTALGTICARALKAGVRLADLAKDLKGTQCHSMPCCLSVVADQMELHAQSKEVKG